MSCIVSNAVLTLEGKMYARITIYLLFCFLNFCEMRVCPIAASVPASCDMNNACCTIAWSWSS